MKEEFSVSQMFQQQKLLEFQRQSKRQQVENSHPLNHFYNSQQSSDILGQKLAAFQHIQQNQQYEHKLQQQYEIPESLYKETFKSIKNRSQDTQNYLSTNKETLVSDNNTYDDIIYPNNSQGHLHKNDSKLSNLTSQAF